MAFSVAAAEAARAASCDRLRRFLRSGLGPVLLKWFARQASRFGYHGTRTMGIGFRRRDKVAPRALVGAAGAGTFLLTSPPKKIFTNFRDYSAKRLRFYEDAAKVVQRRMVPNFKKSFERAVRTARR